MKTKVTIKDVAKLAGVSPSTVSRVVSGKGKISQQTIDKVQESIEELGYVPNYTARSLANSNTDTIAVLVNRGPTSLNNTYFTDAIQAIAQELSIHNKELLLIFSEDNHKERDKIKSLVEMNRIDGVIKLSVKLNDPTVDYLSEKGVPAVVIGNPEKKDRIVWVDNDNEIAMYEVVESLVADGKKDLCFVGGSMNFIVTKDRLRGFVKACEDYGLDVDKDDVYELSFTWEDAYKNADTIISKGYDAIICTDDLIALGIQKRALEIGKRVYVTGFNNAKESNFSLYPIPSVDIKTDKLGKWAVKLLLDQINGDKKVVSKIIKTEFIKK